MPRPRGWKIPNGAARACVRGRVALAIGIGAASLSACSGGSPPAPAEPRHSPPAAAADASAPRAAAAADDSDAALAVNNSKAVARALKKVSALRGIAATKPVPGVKLDRAALVQRVKEKALREYPPEALKREGLLLQLVGFAPPSFDYLGEMMKLLGAQLEGFYEPKNGTMYLASESEGAEAEATLAHELVHALQDQKWDLRQRSDYRPGRSDETMALACLAEGDATSLMLDFLMQPSRTALDVPPDAMRALMQTGMNMGDVQSVPRILRSTLLAPYLEGVGFVHALREKGGWRAVDRAWERLPTTTEQILHADKWESGEAAAPVPAPSAAALGAGWTKTDDDSYGELGLALTLAEWMSDEDARSAASGWGGDRTAVYSKGDEIAFAAHFQFDAAPAPKSDAFAERAFSKISSALLKQKGKPALKEAKVTCFERAELGPLLVTRNGRDLVLVVGPARTGSKWTSTATCSTAKAWATEVVAQR